MLLDKYLNAIDTEESNELDLLRYNEELEKIKKAERSLSAPSKNSSGNSVYYFDIKKIEEKIQEVVASFFPDASEASIEETKSNKQPFKPNLSELTSKA